MKYFLMLIVLFAACTKSKKTAQLHDFVCVTVAEYNYRSTDNAYYLAHGSYRFVSTTTRDTIYSVDSSARLNYMFTADNYINPPILFNTIADTAIYLGKITDCQRSPYLN